MNRSKNLLISVSGGRSSAAMAIIIDRYKSQYPQQNKVMVFANTGHELQETIDFLIKLRDYLPFPMLFIEPDYSNPNHIHYKIKNPKNLHFGNRIYENCIDYLQRNKWTGVPNQNTPYCSPYMKKRPIRAFAKDYFGTVAYTTALGYRKEDMPKRITISALDASKGKYCAPLLTHFDYPMGLRDLDRFWDGMPFKLGIVSDFGNCTLCWKKSDRTLARIIATNEHQNQLNWLKKMEAKYNNFFLRGNRSYAELEKLANSLPLSLFDDNGDPCECGI